jgi:hypothetical protein
MKLVTALTEKAARANQLAQQLSQLARMHEAAADQLRIEGMAGGSSVRISGQFDLDFTAAIQRVIQDRVDLLAAEMKGLFQNLEPVKESVDG